MLAQANALAAWCSALAGLAYSALCLQLWHQGFARGGWHTLRVRALASAACCAMWGWSTLALAVGAGALVGLAADLFDLLRYAAWLAVVLGLLGAPRQQRLGLTLLALQLLFLGLTWWPHAPAVLAVLPAQRLVLLGHLALPILCLVLLEQVQAQVREEMRWGIKPLCLGLAGLFVFELYLFAGAVLFGQPDADTLALRGAMHAAVVPLLGLSALRQRHWLGRVWLSPRATVRTLALLGVGLYLLFLSGMGYYVRYFGPNWGQALQQGLLFVSLAGLLVLLASGTARASLRALVGRHFFRYRFDYREEWLRFTATLSQRGSSDSSEPVLRVGQQIARALAELLDCPSAALWALAPDGERLQPCAAWNQPLPAQPLDSSAPLCRHLAEQGSALELHALAHQDARREGLALPDWLAPAAAWLLVPLLQDQALIGFCVLQPPRVPMGLDWEVRDLLRTASLQAAGCLAQAQGDRSLLEARKFEAFGQMSAFVAHDLKNIVTELGLMLQNAQRLHDNPAFRQDMLRTIAHALERMRALLLQLRPGSFAVAPSGQPDGVDLQELLQRIAEQCQCTRGQQLELHSQGPLHVQGQPLRLERVLGHVVHNALDATAGGGRAWVRLARQGQQGQVCIGDSGSGMSARFVQECLFKPFYSTKPAGMGLGAYESLLYVRELGGSIAVDSAEGQGTLVTLNLPLCPPAGTLETGTGAIENGTGAAVAAPTPVLLHP